MLSKRLLFSCLHLESHNWRSHNSLLDLKVHDGGSQSLLLDLKVHNRPSCSLSSDLQVHKWPLHDLWLDLKVQKRLVPQVTTYYQTSISIFELWELFANGPGDTGGSVCIMSTQASHIIFGQHRCFWFRTGTPISNVIMPDPT